MIIQRNDKFGGTKTQKLETRTSHGVERMEPEKNAGSVFNNLPGCDIFLDHGYAFNIMCMSDVYE